MKRRISTVLIVMTIASGLPSAAHARYLQADPIGPTRNYSDPALQVAIRAGIPLQQRQEGDPEGLNHPYAYTNNNPLKFVDPFGLENGDPWPSLYLNRYNTGESSALSRNQNNARFNQCYETCMRDPNASSYVEQMCSAAGIAAGTKRALTGAAVEYACQGITRDFVCYTHCSDEEKQCK